MRSWSPGSAASGVGASPRRSRPNPGRSHRRARHPATPGALWRAPRSSGPTPPTRSCPGWWRPPRSTRAPHPPRGRLHHHGRPGAARDQRHRHHESVAAAGAAGDRSARWWSSPPPSSTGRPTGPVLLLGERAAPGRPAPGWNGPSSRSRATCPISPRTIPPPPSSSALLERARPRPRDGAVPGARLPGARSSRLRSPPAVHPSGGRGRRSLHVVVTDCRAPSTSPATGCSAGGTSAVSSAGAGRRSPPGARGRPRAAAPLGLVDLPPDCSACCATGGVSTIAASRDGFRYRYTTAGAVEDFARRLRLEGTVGRRREARRADAAVEDFFRRSPAVIERRGAGDVS